jgi:hypothetical protein
MTPKAAMKPAIPPRTARRGEARLSIKPCQRGHLWAGGITLPLTDYYTLR